MWLEIFKKFTIFVEWTMSDREREAEFEVFLSEEIALAAERIFTDESVISDLNDSDEDYNKDRRKVVNDEGHSGNVKSSSEDVNVSVLYWTKFTEEVKLQDFYFFGNKWTNLWFTVWKWTIRLFQGF